MIASAPSDRPEPSNDGRRSDDEHSRRDDLGEFIRKQREQAKLSLRNLSKLAGVSNPYLSQIERGLRNPSAEILQAIAKALDLSAETLYVRAGILDERKDGDTESAIARDPHLTEHQRATLIEMYRTFRSVSGLDVGTAGAASPVGHDTRHGMVDRLVGALTSSSEDEPAAADGGDDLPPTDPTDRPPAP